VPSGGAVSAAPAAAAAGGAAPAAAAEEKKEEKKEEKVGLFLVHGRMQPLILGDTGGVRRRYGLRSLRLSTLQSVHITCQNTMGSLKWMHDLVNFSTLGQH
jgi:hypothetical protein